MSFPPNIKVQALVACGRFCCICHQFCGTKIEVHHIQLSSEGGDDTYENAIPLCFNCHADMSSYDKVHPKGTKYTSQELKLHRDNWYKKVAGSSGFLRPDEVIETDKKVFEHLTQLLLWDGSIIFLREHDFRGSFYLDHIRELHRFLEACKNPTFEFTDPDLESLRALLIAQINEYSYLTAARTFPVKGSDLQQVPKEWEMDNPKLYYEVTNTLNSLADKICGSYDSLVKLATRKLGINPSL